MKRPPSFTAWVLARLLQDWPVDDAILYQVCDDWQAMATWIGRKALAYRRGCLERELRRRLWSAAEISSLLADLERLDLSGQPPECAEECERDAELDLPYILTPVSAVQEQAVQWLWEPRVPQGMITLFAGDPKLGKSFVTLDIAARVSRGAALPLDGPGEPGSVILLSAEDDPARTIRPRLKSAGAHLEKVHILESVHLESGLQGLPSLKTDLAKIEHAAASLEDCRLLVVDPVSAYLGRTDDHRNSELRGLLSPLKDLAQRTNLAVLLVSHLTKGPRQGINPLHCVTGSLAYTGAARANFLFLRDSQDASGKRVLLADSGCNLAAAVPTLAFKIGDAGEGPVVQWEKEPVELSAAQVLERTPWAGQNGSGGDETATARCGAWLLQSLELLGKVPAAEVAAAAQDVGFTIPLLREAKKRLGVRTVREGFGPGSQFYWELPSGSVS